MTHKSFDDYKKQFCKMFHSIDRKYNFVATFSDWLEIAAIATHQAPYHQQLLEIDDPYNHLEEIYLNVINQYDAETRNIFAELFALLQMVLCEHQRDFLGEIYMELEISNKKSGQFFTPYHVSQMMAKISLNNIGGAIKEKGYFTISEPASGAGGMLMAAAEAVREQGYDPREVMLFQAIDISRMCFNMSYIQLSLLNLSGVVLHGDTIRWKIWEKRATPPLRVTQRQLRDAKGEHAPDLIERLSTLSTEAMNKEGSPEEKQLTLF